MSPSGQLPAPPVLVDAAEIAEAVAATRRAARRGLLDSACATFRIGWAGRIRAMSSFAAYRDRYRRQYDDACAAAGALLSRQPDPPVGTMLPVVRECVAADQAVRAFINHPAGGILHDRVATVERVTRVAAAMLAEHGTQVSPEVMVAELVSAPSTGSYLELELEALAPAVEQAQTASDPDRELDAIVAGNGFGDVAIRLFQGQTGLLGDTLRQLVAALAGRSPADLLRQIRLRRQAAHRRRAELLAQLGAVLPPELVARLHGALADIDELSTLDNRDDTARSLAFDGLPDLLLRRRLFDTLKQRGCALPDGVFDLHQDDLLEMAEQYV